jgi:hypothetical protein
MATPLAELSETKNLWMTCAYRVQNLCLQHTKPQPDSLRGECVTTTLGGAYPLGAADDFTLRCDERRRMPTDSSQGGSNGMGIEVLLPDDRWSHCSS